MVVNIINLKLLQVLMLFSFNKKIFFVYLLNHNFLYLLIYIFIHLVSIKYKHLYTVLLTA